MHCDVTYTYTYAQVQVQVSYLSKRSQRAKIC